MYDYEYVGRCRRRCQPEPSGPCCPVPPCPPPALGCVSGDHQDIPLVGGNIEVQVALPDAVFPAQCVEYAEGGIRILQTGYYQVSYYVQAWTRPASVWYAYGKLNGSFTPLLDDRNYVPTTGNVTLRGESAMHLNAGDILQIYVNADSATTLTVRDVGGAQLFVMKLPLMYHEPQFA